MLFSQYQQIPLTTGPLTPDNEYRKFPGRQLLAWALMIFKQLELCPTDHSSARGFPRSQPHSFRSPRALVEAFFFCFKKAKAPARCRGFNALFAKRYGLGFDRDLV